MPEGHSVHRIALQLGADFVGREVAASSPQGRFAAGAALLDGSTVTDSRAVGKHLLVAFERPGSDAGAGRSGSAPSDGARGRDGTDGVRWLHVHLGLYGAWDFHGRISPITPDSVVTGSIGAPRLRRGVVRDRGIRMSEVDQLVGPEDEGSAPFPPDPVGQVRLRLLTAESLADLRGPSRCEVLTPDEVAGILTKAGPDPRVDSWPDPRTGTLINPWPDAEGTFVERLTSRGVPVGQLLMDQSVVSGIGNIYRAEMLFRAGLAPHVAGRRVPAEVARGLWRDWVRLLDDGVRTGVMLTRPEHDPAGPDGTGPDEAARAAAIADRSLRWAVYGRAGQPCYVCGTPISLELMAARKLYWCPTCQT